MGNIPRLRSRGYRVLHGRRAWWALLLSLAGLGPLVVLTGPETDCRAAPLPREKPAAHRNYTETIPGTRVRFDMVAIPGGIYRMGSLASEKGREADEGPRHLVRVGPFWMGKTEVTWDEYELFLYRRAVPKLRNRTPAQRKADAITRPSLPYIDHHHGFGGPGYPAIGISHHAAMEYCRWLSAMTGKVYRLPTEAEWEYAARADTQTAYFFGDDPRKLGEYAWYDANSGDATHPVGKKKASPWGLRDIYGNAAEWCLDMYDRDYYRKFRPTEIALSPVLLPTERRFAHVVRGGSWADGAAQCRSAARRASDPAWNRSDPNRPTSIWWLADEDFVGFRVVRAVEETPRLRGLRSKVTRDSK